MKSSQLLLKSITQGFTLLELLLASAMTLIVVTLAGMAVAQVIQGNLQTRADSQLQYDTNRATEYISDEIRKATTVETDVTTEFNRIKAVSAYGSNFDQQMTPILILTIPEVGEKVIYYTISRSRVDGQDLYKNHRNWLVGQPDSLVLYRWGYDRTRESATVNDKNTPAAWKPQPILDNLDSTMDKPTCGSDPTNLIRRNAILKSVPAVSSTATTIPQGFYSCVAYSKKYVELHLKVKYHETDDVVKQKATEYEVKTQVATRASSAFQLNGTLITFLSSGTLNIVIAGDTAGNSSFYGDALSGAIINGADLSIPGSLIGKPIGIQFQKSANEISKTTIGFNPNAGAYYNGNEIDPKIVSYIPDDWKEKWSDGTVHINIQPNEIIVFLKNSISNTYTLYKLRLQ